MGNSHVNRSSIDDRKDAPDDDEDDDDSGGAGAGVAVVACERDAVVVGREAMLPLPLVPRADAVDVARVPFFPLRRS